MDIENKRVYTFRYAKDGAPYGTWTIFSASEQAARMELAVKYRLGDTPLELVESFPDRRKTARREVDNTKDAR